MKQLVVILWIGLGVAACSDGQQEVYCDGPAIVATRGDYLLQQDCRLLCSECPQNDLADGSVCQGGDAGAPHCPCNDNGPVTFCWVAGEVAIFCDASVCP